MTPALTVTAFALVLVAGWALLRSAGRPTTGTAPKGGAHLLLDQSPVGALLLDPPLRITWANDSFCGLFYVRARGGGAERWIQHTCQVIEKKPLSGGRVAYFVDVTPRKNNAPGQQAREILLHELDQILLTLARRSDGPEGDELSLLREVAESTAGALKRDRWELWSLSEDRARWTLDHLNYATQRQREESTPEISVPQTGPYLRKLEQVRVLVTSDVESDPEGEILLGQGRIGPGTASRMEVPIRILGKVVGVLVIAHHTARPWTPDESRFAASIGDHMSFIAGASRAGATGEAEIQVPTVFPAAASSNIDGFINLDENLRFTFLNPAVLQWLEERGVDGSQLVGRTLEESMKGIRDRSIVAEVRKAARGGGPARLRRQLDRDGPWLDLYVNPSATGVSVTLQNRARRKQRETERSLRDSETRFRSVVESLREGLVITDLSDCIVYVNSRITDLTGHRPEDLDGKQAQDLLFDTANWKDRDSRMTARRERKRTRYNAPLLDRDGKVVSVEVISTPLRDADGAVTGVVDAITAVENPEGLRTASLAT